MATDYAPGIPTETISQIRDLLDRFKEIDLDTNELRNCVFSAMGKLRIDTQGINFSGNFGTMGINSEEFEAVKESTLKAVDVITELLPLLKGKEFVVKTEDKTTKIKLGYIPRWQPATQADMDDEKVPIVEILGTGDSGKSRINTLADKLSGEVSEGASRVKIHRIEEFAGWFPTWKEFGDIMNITVPLLALTKMKTIKRISASLPAFLSDVLDRCGEGKSNE